MTIKPIMVTTISSLAGKSLSQKSDGEKLQKVAGLNSQGSMRGSEMFSPTQPSYD